METGDSLRTGLPLSKRLWSHLRPGDWLIMLLFVALAAGSFWLGGWVGTSEDTTTDLVAVVTVGNQQMATLSLTKPTDFVVHGALGEMLLQVANHHIRVLHSTCPNQVCVRQGAVQQAGEMLVCVPNRVVLLIRRASEAKFTKTSGDSVTSGKTTSDNPTSDYDAVTY